MRLQKPDEHDPAARIRIRKEEARAKAEAAAPAAAPAPALLELDPADIDLLPPLPEEGGGLDKVMLAMDVVDTLRHQQDLVEHALSQDERDAELIARIRRIYADQGIEVSDAAITEGVQALKKDRFVYQPPARGFGRRLAHLYVDRGKWTRRAGIVGGLVLAVWLAFAVPDWIEAGQRAGAVRTEVADLRSRLAQAQDGLFRTLGTLQRVVTRITDGAKQNRVGFLRELQRRLGQRIARRLVTRATDRRFLERQAEDGNVIALIVEPGQIGNFLATRPTPGGPVVDHHPLTAVITQLVRLPVQIGQLEIQYAGASVGRQQQQQGTQIFHVSLTGSNFRKDLIERSIICWPGRSISRRASIRARSQKLSSGRSSSSPSGMSWC